MRRNSNVIGRLKFIIEHPLNKNDALKALRRFFIWQVISRISREGITYKWINDTTFKVKQGESGLSINIYTGLQEFSEMAFLLHFLRREDLFLDIGANLGSYSLLASSTVGANSIAVEPHPQTMKRLKENVTLNQATERVVFVEKAVGSSSTKTRLTENYDSMNYLLDDNLLEEKSVEVDVETMDVICGESVPALIKIDVEGYELFVLEGGKKVLGDSKCKALIVEVNSLQKRYKVSSDEIIRLVASLGFKPFHYEAFDRELIPLPGLNTTQGNTLFIKDFDFVNTRIKKAAKFSVFGKRF